MKKCTLSIGLFGLVAILSTSCHFFDDFEDIDNGCPPNSGYPCACDPEHKSSDLGIGHCDDGSDCLFWEEDPEKGFCSDDCFGANDSNSCLETKKYGLDGAPGACRLTTGGDKTVFDHCVVVCEFVGSTGSCPPGLQCQKLTDVESYCVPPTGENSSSSDNDNNDRPPSCECAPDEFQCVGDSIRKCSDGCNWSEFSCDFVCENEGGYGGDCSYSYDSNHDVCWCNGTY